MRVEGAGDKLPAPGAEQPTASGPAAFWGALALIVLAICSFMVDWATVSKCGNIDLRNRVTGIRLLVSGQDPYHTKWSPGQSERICDPYDNPALPITKTTVTPAMLMVGWPWALLPYPATQLIWLLAQWGLLAGLWFIWFRWSGHTANSRWWWTALVVGFTYTLAWRHHMDRGQGYLLWALLLAVWMRLGLGKNATKHGWVPGLVAGLLVCMRPPLLLVIGPMLVLRRRNQWLGALVGLLLGLGVPAGLKPTVWQDYGRAMETWSTVYRTNSEPRPGKRAFPPTVEGVPTDQLAHFEVIQFADSSLFRLCRWGGWPTVPAPVMLAVLGLAFGMWLWRCRGAGDAAFMLGLAAWSFLTDAFLPAYRYPYDDVMILNTLALLPVMGLLRWPARVVAMMAIAAGIWVVSIQPAGRWPIYVPTLALAGLALLALFRSTLTRKEESNPVPAC